MKLMKEEIESVWRSDIIDSMAKAIFVSAYASMIEEYCQENGIQKRDLPDNIEYAGPQEDWSDHHPPISEEAKKEAESLATEYERMNGKSLDELLKEAESADGVEDIDSEYAEDFGHYLAMMALGHGVSWFDNHEEFELKSPHIEFYLDPEDVGLSSEYFNVKEFANKLLEFHEGQNDPIYSIGSSLLAGNLDVLEDIELIDDAIHSLQKEKEVNDEYAGEIDDLIAELENQKSKNSTIDEGVLHDVLSRIKKVLLESKD